MTTETTRRDLLKFAGVSLATPVLAAPVLGAPAAPAAESLRKPALRFLHLPDTHIQPEDGAPEGVAACLQHVAESGVEPAFMLVAGDIIMDSMGTDTQRAKAQWDVWNRVVAGGWRGPVKYCIGDHDCWGIAKDRSGCTGNESLYGKKMACDVLGLEKTYYSFDQAGWHFIVLDSIYQPADAVYEARLDDEQFEWLTGDLQKVAGKSPIVIHSHIPILTAGATMPRERGNRPERPPQPGQQANQRRGFQLPEGVRGTFVPPRNMHLDVVRIKNLFGEHPNVKLCLSGHLHIRERVEYNGVAYISNGAVCGNYWYGDTDRTPAGYGVIDLYDDGSFDERYVAYGWDWQTHSRKA